MEPLESRRTESNKETMEAASKSFTAQLILAESEIAHATHQLEKVFTNMAASEEEEISGRSSIATARSTKQVNPIKLIRRLTALEMSLNTLQTDCEMIQNKRNSIVQTTLQLQHDNVQNVQKVRFVKFVQILGACLPLLRMSRLFVALFCRYLNNYRKNHRIIDIIMIMMTTMLYFTITTIRRLATLVMNGKTYPID